jgi:hypothetical protein
MVKGTRRAAALLSVAAMLCVCGITARAQGVKQLRAWLSNNQNVAAPASWELCNGTTPVPGKHIFAYATGYDSSLNVTCQAVDGTGSTGSNNCAAGAYHKAQLMAGSFIPPNFGTGEVLWDSIFPFEWTTNSVAGPITKSARLNDEMTCRTAAAFTAWASGTN